MNEDRFVKIDSQGKECKFEVWLDKKTGVNYLTYTNGNVGGITVLYDADGSPLTTSPWMMNN